MNSAPDPTTVESRSLAAQPVVSIRSVIPIDQLGAVMGPRMRALSDYLRQSGAPVAAPTAGAGAICGGVLSEGAAISTWHFGPHQRLGEAYARLDAWLQTQGRAAAGPPWEIYHWIDPRRDPAEQDPAQWGTQLVQPIE